MEFHEFLKLQIGNKSLGYIEAVTGVSKSHISKLLRNLRVPPRPKTLARLAKGLPCSYSDLMNAAGYLMPGDDNKLSDEQYQWLALFDSLSPKQRKAIFAVAEGMLENSERLKK